MPSESWNDVVSRVAAKVALVKTSVLTNCNESGLYDPGARSPRFTLIGPLVVENTTAAAKKVSASEAGKSGGSPKMPA